MATFRAVVLKGNVGIDKYTVHEMLNHVVEEMKVTDMYIRKDWSLFDKTNRKVLDFVFKTDKI